MYRYTGKNGTLAHCQELGIRLIADSPIEMGLLTGKYGPHSLPPDGRARNYSGILSIPGAKNANQAQENAGSPGWKLKEDEVARLDEASDAITA